MRAKKWLGACTHACHRSHGVKKFVIGLDSWALSEAWKGRLSTLSESRQWPMSFAAGRYVVTTQKVKLRQEARLDSADTVGSDPPACLHGNELDTLGPG